MDNKNGNSNSNTFALIGKLERIKFGYNLIPLIFFFILFFLFSLKLKAQSDSTKSIKPSISLEVYPSPIYSVYNMFKEYGPYPIPFKTKVSIDFKNRWSVGLGIEERLHFSTENNSQWFLTSDFYFINRKKNRLSINSDIGMFSYLGAKSSGDYLRTMEESYFVGYFVRGGITWKKRIIKDIYSLFYLGYETNINRQIHSNNIHYWSMKVGLNFNSTYAESDNKFGKKLGFIISGFVFNSLYSRKNEVVVIPFDRFGNLTERQNLYKNGMIFLGRITPGIELSLNRLNRSFHSLGFSFFRNLMNYNFYYISLGNQDFNVQNLNLYYDYSHIICAYHLISPYLGLRLNLAKNNLTYENRHNTTSPQADLDEYWNFNSSSVFLQLTTGAKILDKKLFLDAGLTMNFYGLMKGYYTYDYKYFEWNFGTRAFSREGNDQKTLVLGDFINDKYFFGSIFLKLGYNF